MQGEINISRLKLFALKFHLLEHISHVLPDTAGPFQGT